MASSVPSLEPPKESVVMGLVLTPQREQSFDLLGLVSKLYFSLPSSSSSSLVSSPSPGSSQSRGTALAPPVLSASNRGSQRPSPGPASRPAPPGWPASSASHLPAALDRKRTALHSTWARSGGGPWPPCTGTRIVALGLRTPRAPQRWLLPGRCCYAVAPVASCCCYSASCCPSPAPST